MPSTRTIKVPSQELEGLIANMDRDPEPSDIIDDGSKVNDIPEYDDGLAALVTPAPDESRVLLLNLRFRNEKLYKPEVDEFGKRHFSTMYPVQFIDGYLTTDRETADWVKAAAPYVYEEPQNPGVPPFEFDMGQKGKFRTWNQEAYNTFVRSYYESL